MDLGAIEQSIAKQAIRAGQPIPERIAQAPKLRFGLLFYLQAFFDLDAERSQGMGIGRIPWSAILSYANYYCLNDESTDDLVYLLRSMDVAHLNRLEAKREKK